MVLQGPKIVKVRSLLVQVYDSLTKTKTGPFQAPFEVVQGVANLLLNLVNPLPFYGSS